MHLGHRLAGVDLVSGKAGSQLGARACVIVVLLTLLMMRKNKRMGAVDNELKLAEGVATEIKRFREKDEIDHSFDDMAKAIERGMRIEGIRLLEKRGGKSGHFQAQGA